MLRNPDIITKESELKKVREAHFLAKTPERKRRCREQDAQLRAEIAKLLKTEGWGVETAKELALWDPYDQNASAGFFDPEWMFGMTEGFDIVIGNPPYGIVFDANMKNGLQNLYSSFRQNTDIYTAFFERGIDLLRTGGDFAFITPNTYLNGDYFKSLRHFLSSKTVISEVTDYKEVSVFDDPTVFVAVLLCSAAVPLFPYVVRLRIAQASLTQFSELQVALTAGSDAPLKPSNMLLARLNNDPMFAPLESLFLVKDVGFNYWTTGRGKKRGQNSIGNRVFYSGARLDKRDVPFLKGRDVSKWTIGHATNFLRHDYESYLDPEIDTFRFSLNYLARRPKVIYRQTSNNIVAAIDTEGRYLDKTVHLIVPAGDWDSALSETLLVGLLNSALFRYLYTYISQETEGRAFAQVKTTYIKRLPVPNKPSETSRQIQGIVERILVEHSEDGRTNLEAQLDEAVFRLYGITPDEKLLLEGSSA